MKIQNKFLKAVLTLLIVGGPFYAIGQQDPIYSQYIFNLQTVNPAYVGSWQTLGFLAIEQGTVGRNYGTSNNTNLFISNACDFAKCWNRAGRDG